MIERYEVKAISSLFSDESRYEAYLKVEIASLEAWAKLGVVPSSDLALIKQKAKVDVKRIAELEEITHHDVVAFTRQISETLGPEKKWVHYGLTSTDVVDTALSTLYQKANDVIERDFAGLLAALKEKAIAYEFTPCIGRTHGMHAEVTSFGLKWLSFYEEWKHDQSLFGAARRYLEVAKLSGAVGNYANVDPFVQDDVAKSLGLGSAVISTQVLSRDRHEAYGAALAIAASTMERISTEIRNLSRSEILEVEEGFSKGQKGSSAMPQKRNPISSENLCGCARMIRGYLTPLLEDNALYHERDISHSSVERVAFIDMIELFAYMIERETKVVESLRVFPERMLSNISLSHGAVYSQRVLSELIAAGMSRESAYDLIQPLAMAANLEGKDFESALLASEPVKKALGEEKIRACFTNDYYLKNVPFLYRRVLDE